MVTLKKNKTSIYVAQKVLNLKIEALRLLKRSINKDFEKAVYAIISCNSKIILCGVGKSGLIAAKIASTMSSVGSPAFSLSANDCLHGDLGSISKKDLLILISINRSFFEILPRSPCKQSLADKENAGLPTEDIVDAIFAAINPLFPTPHKIIFELQEIIAYTAFSKSLFIDLFKSRKASIFKFKTF